MARRLLIANAGAGSAEDEAVDRAAAVLGRAGGVRVARTADLDELAAVLAEERDADVVVAGGDGSLHACVNALHRAAPERLRQQPLGVVPMGTGNDLATHLGLPDDPAAAAEVAVTGRTRRLDLLALDHGVVAVNADHAGIGALAATRGEALKSVAGPLAYRLGALAVAADPVDWTVTVTADGVVAHDGPVLFVAVALGPTVGGGVELAPDADPSDGTAEVLVVGAVDGLLGRLRLAASAAKGEHVDRPEVQVHRGADITIEGDPMPHDVDGELTDPLARVRYEVVPQAWAVRVP